MKNNKKIDVLFYLIVIIIGIIIAVSYNLSINKTYKTLKELAYKEKEIVLKQSVENIITVIDTVREDYIANLNKTSFTYDDQKTIDLKIKELSINIIKSQNTNKNQYFWINEVIDYEGGDNYAIRLVHQNLSDTEGIYLSTNTKDYEGNLPYLYELEKIKEDGYVLHDYYFKNKVDDRITKKLSYAKLYKPYNWIIATGLPYEDIYYQANILHERNKNRIALIYIIDIFFTLFFCLTYCFYRKKEIYKEKEKEAIEKNKFKTEFIDGITHDLRTPLNSIVALSDLINNKDYEEDELSQFLLKINMSSKYVLTLIDDVLDVSALEEGKLIVKDNIFNIKEIIHPLTSVFSLYCEDKNIKFNCYIENIEYENMYGDAVRIRQILTNLLSNSIKFTDSGGSVNFKIVQSNFSSEKALLTLSISDTGCGISQENLKHIFNKFEQGNLSIRKKYGGNGLGLSIVNNLVNLMNGKIFVQSKIDEGSTFKVEIPFNIACPSVKKIKFKKTFNILIVDNHIDSKLFYKQSENYGLNCVLETDINSAIEVINDKKTKNEYFDYLFISFEKKTLEININKILSITDKEKTELVLSSYSKIHYDKEFAFKEIRRPILFSSILEVLNEKVSINQDYNENNIKDFSSIKILLVEDNEINKFVATKVLTSKGAKVEFALNGEEAIEIFNNRGDDYFDLILMDKKMPIVDGIEATKRIRNSKLRYSSKIPIYGLSANSSNEAVKQCLDSGMDGYITKPIDVKQIYKIIDKIKNK